MALMTRVAKAIMRMEVAMLMVQGSHVGAESIEGRSRELEGSSRGARGELERS